MKLYIPGIEKAICFRECSVHSLVIENQAYLYKTLSDFKAQLCRISGESVLSKKDIPVEMSKHVDLVTDLFGFDLNSRALSGKIVSALDCVALDETHMVKTQSLLSQIEEYLNELSDGFTCQMSFENLSMLQIIKASGMSVPDEFESFHERVYAYMETVTEFLGEKLFIFVGLRSFVPDDEMQLLLDTAINHRLNLLMIEPIDRRRLVNENRITIDKDLCEF